jgi:hypothetical protein
MTMKWILPALVCGTAFAQPVLQIISPEAATAGAPGFPLILRGSGFLPGAMVRFGGSELAALSVSPTEVKVNITAGLVSKAGAIPVLVSNPGSAASNALVFQVRPGLAFITAPRLAAAASGKFYTQAIAVTGGIGPYRFSSDGALPPGVSLNASTGALAGFPTTEGQYRFGISVSDASNASVRQGFELAVARPVSIETNMLPPSTAGQSYSAQLHASGGQPPYVWRITQGALPAGVTLSTGGQIVGTPAASGTFGFTVEATDSAGLAAVTALAVNVQGALAIVAASNLIETTPDQDFRVGLAASGGIPPYVWRLTAGQLPPGIVLHAGAGTLEGKPAAPGAYAFTIEVNDRLNQRASLEMRIAVSSRLSAAAQTLPAATMGSPYRAVLTAEGGTPPYRWRIASGSLPQGLVLDGAGVIQGTPMALVELSADVEVTDAASSTVRQTYRLAVSLPPAPGLLVKGLELPAGSAQQIPITVEIDRPFPVELNGTLTIRAAAETALQFTIGGRTGRFVIPAGTMKGQFNAPLVALQTGTTAGRIEIDGELHYQERQIAAPRLMAVLEIPRRAPVVSRIGLKPATGGFEVELSGYSNTRDLSGAVFEFESAPGSDLRTTSLNVSIESRAASWFTSYEAGPLGGIFLYRQSFNVLGDPAAWASVSVRLANSEGQSAAVSAARISTGQQ